MIPANETDAECYARLLRSFEHQPAPRIVPLEDRPAQRPVARCAGHEDFAGAYGPAFKGGDWYHTYQREHRQGGW